MDIKNIKRFIAECNISGLKENISSVSEKKSQTELILYAINKVNHDAIKLFCESGWDFNEKFDFYEPPIVMAARKSKHQHDNIKLILKLDIDVNAKDDNGRTPLMMAVEQRKPDLVKLLLDAGADTDLQDKWGSTALMLAVTPYERGRSDDFLGCIKHLLDYKANINMLDSEGDSALLRAMENYNTLCFNYFVERGADLDLPNRNGSTPLHLASLLNEIVYCEKLLSSGANIDVQNNLGMTALHFSVIRNINLDVLRFLIDRGADSSIKDNDGETFFDIVNKRHADKLNEEQKAEMESLFLFGVSDRDDVLSERLCF